MHNPVNDITTGGEGSNASNPWYDDAASRLFADFSQQASPQSTPDVNSFATAPSDQSRPSELTESNPFATPPYDQSTPQLPKDTAVPNSSSSFADFLNVDATDLFNKPKAAKDNSTQVAKIEKQINADSDHKEAYMNKLRALAKEPNQLSDADIAKIKANAMKSPSEKPVPFADGPSEHGQQRKQGNLDKNFDPEAPGKAKPEGLEENKTIELKPLNKPVLKQRAQENETIEQKPLKKPEQLKPEVVPEPLTNGEDEALREYEMNAHSTASEASNANRGEGSPESTDAAVRAADAAPEIVNRTGLGDKCENLSAVLNAQKEFRATVNDGTSFVQRADGTCTLDSAEGRTKVSTDGLVTVTVNGVEQQFHFDNANREQKHPDGSVSYHFSEGTTVTELSENGTPRGLMIRQPNGTTIETNYAQPSKPRYARGGGR